jgi:hypothetical protein
LQVILGTYSWLARRRTADRELEYIQRGMKAAVRLAEHLDHLIDALRQHEPAAGIALKPVAFQHRIPFRCITPWLQSATNTPISTQITRQRCYWQWGGIQLPNSCHCGKGRCVL